MPGIGRKILYNIIAFLTDSIHPDYLHTQRKSEEQAYSQQSTTISSFGYWTVTTCMRQGSS